MQKLNIIKPIMHIGLLALFGISYPALAINCSESGSIATHDAYQRVTGDLNALLSGKTACQSKGVDWEWQEFHDPSGTLIDWKKGPQDAVDPSEKVGSWHAENSQTPNVTYTYESGVNTYQVWQRSDDKYDFCNGNAIAVEGVSLKSGQAACP